MKSARYQLKSHRIDDHAIQVDDIQLDRGFKFTIPSLIKKKKNSGSILFCHHLINKTRQNYPKQTKLDGEKSNKN